MTSQIEKHRTFIKSHTEYLAVSLGYFGGSVLCFSYAKKLDAALFYFSGTILLLLSTTLLWVTINDVQKHVEETLETKHPKIGVLVGILYAICVVPAGVSFSVKIISG